MAGACGGQARRAAETPQQVVAWRTIGSWSGRGNRQTESFTSDTGALRVRWAVGPVGGTGAFRVTAHSAIRYVNQDPHVFYLMVESDRVDWTFSVEEAIAGTVTAPR